MKKKNNHKKKLKPTMSTSTSPKNDPQETLYFAYGSNLWLHQMRLRCPSSTYVGTARLPGYKWMINARGYANIAPSSPSPTSPSPTDKANQPNGEDNKEQDDEVWGLVYTLPPVDEAQLDRNEGVPIAYTKEILPCSFYPSSSPSSTTTLSPSTTKDMLVYIDHLRATPSYTPRKEYIVRMNKGIADALDKGVPRGYVEGVLRRYIPKEEGGDGEEKALEQARMFRDESGVF
ncbi:hypothetical protein DM02DRAFT_617149 [Periconia macrospinosa]|uniref:gamma-glutamylcyclotransferase n=1 Tax=Periconia macrospinosa TaxID=97972 RepID=A0A2V1DEM1_9PLEO|nr:hypothetical protein DM02DRAFT_617149 [Periconia macrospinosa]